MIMARRRSRQLLAKGKVPAAIEVRRIPKGSGNLLCSNHGEEGWELGEVRVLARIPGLGQFETYLCVPCAERLSGKVKR